MTEIFSIPYSSHRQGQVESAVNQLKRKLSQLLYDEAETRLTPFESTSALSTACSLINQLLILTTESTQEEKHICVLLTSLAVILIFRTHPVQVILLHGEDM